MKDLLNLLNDNKEWIFSGIGITVFTFFCKIIKIIKNQFIKKREAVNNTLDTNSNNIISVGDKSNMIVEDNYSSTVNNYYMNDMLESDFSKRFFRLKKLLNQSNGKSDKEYTDEYISALLGLSNVKELQRYLNSSEPPSDAFKEKFVTVFGVNRDWMVYGQGDKPFKSNIKYRGGNDPTEIVSEGFLNSDDKIIFFVGHDEGNEQIGMFVIKHNEHFYEVVPKQFTFNRRVGATGKSNLVKLYDVIKELDNKNILDSRVYLANKEQTKSLFYGDVAPKAVLKLSPYNGFLNCFLDINQESIERNIKENFLERDVIEVQKIISVEKGLYCEKNNWHKYM